ncbi:MAG: TRAP transporter permease [Pararhodobacter sp.]
MTDSAAPRSETLDTGEEVDTRVRPAEGWPGRVAFWFGVALSLFHIWMNTLGTWPELWQACLHFAGFGFLCALLYPAFHAKTEGGRRAVLALDVALGLAAISLFAYLYFNELSFYRRQQTTGFAWYDWLFTGLALLLAVEFTRRTTGWVIPILIILGFTYVTFWGAYVPGMLTFAGLRTDTMLFRIFYTDDGMFGTVGRISSSYVFMFILFGAFLLRSGAGHFIIDFAQVLARRMIGGPGLVAVIGSGLMGTISGSAVANTVSTGSITIPMMKRAGMPARTAAATEAAASTGGQIMPPIMGAGAFVMASFTQVPYLTIAAVSVIPAILYFVSIAFYVRITAKRLNLAPRDEAGKTLMQVLKENGVAFFVPIGVLVGMMMWGYTPTYAAGFAILAVIAGSWLTRNPMGPMAVLEALALGARNMVMTAVLLIGIGVVITAVTLSGVGNTFSLMISEWSGGSVLVAIALIALASLVLGMGLPVTAAYIVVATLSAPALADMMLRAEIIELIASGLIPPGPGAMLTLGSPQHAAIIGQPMDPGLAAEILAAAPLEFSRMITEQSLSPDAITAAILAAHLIVFWLSQDSSITPPVCLTAFAAAAIAGSRPMATGFTAWKMAKGLYIVPLLFAYSAILTGTLWEKLEIALFTIAALYALAGAFEGHMEAPINRVMRVVMVALCAVLIWPVQEAGHWAALAVFFALFGWNIWQDRQRRAGLSSVGVR